MSEEAEAESEREMRSRCYRERSILPASRRFLRPVVESRSAPVLLKPPAKSPSRREGEGDVQLRSGRPP